MILSVSPASLYVLPVLLHFPFPLLPPPCTPRPRRDPTRLQHCEPSLVRAGVRRQVLHGDDHGISVPDAVVRRVDAERSFLALRRRNARRARGWSFSAVLLYLRLCSPCTRTPGCCMGWQDSPVDNAVRGDHPPSGLPRRGKDASPDLNDGLAA